MERSMRLLAMAAVFLLALVPPNGATPCPHDVRVYAGFGGREVLECGGLGLDGYVWWRRDTRRHGGVRTGCELEEDEWEVFEGCRDGDSCMVGVNSSTVSLEYCCTGEDNPAMASQLKCFILTGQ